MVVFKSLQKRNIFLNFDNFQRTNLTTRLQGVHSDTICSIYATMSLIKMLNNASSPQSYVILYCPIRTMCVGHRLLISDFEKWIKLLGIQCVKLNLSNFSTLLRWRNNHIHSVISITIHFTCMLPISFRLCFSRYGLDPLVFPKCRR